MSASSSATAPPWSSIPDWVRKTARSSCGKCARSVRASELYLATTHFHPEHDLGAAAFPPAAKMIRSRDQQKDIDEFGLSVAKTFSDRSPAMAELLKGAEFRKADIFFETEYALDLGGIRVDCSRSVRATPEAIPRRLSRATTSSSPAMWSCRRCPPLPARIERARLARQPVSTGGAPAGADRSQPRHHGRPHHDRRVPDVSRNRADACPRAEGAASIG